MRDLRAELLRAEAAHFAKKAGVSENTPTSSLDQETPKRLLEEGPGDDAEKEDLETKRRRILEESRDMDADSDGGDSDSSSEDDRYARCPHLNSHNP